MSFLLEIKNDDDLAYKIREELEYLDERDSVKLSQLYDDLFATFLEENQAKKIQIDLDENYTGLKFGEKFEETDLNDMINDFRSNRKIHAKYALKIIDEAINLLKKQPNIRELNLDQSLNSECVVVGDLHGHFDDFLLILNKFNIPGKSCYFVFNGDWVDRGVNQVELILTIFYSFVLRPNNVFLNRGNHEDRAQNSQPTYKPCLKISTLRYFGKYGSVIYSKLDELFKHLPLATIVSNPAHNQRFFIVHGGINDQLNLTQLQKLDRTRFASICRPSSFEKDSLEKRHYKDVVDMLWSDPQTHSNGLDFNKTRNIGKLFGSSVTKKFLDDNNFTNLIRSHECKAQGHEVVHDGRVITVFSASNYNLGNLGAVLKISSTKAKIDLFTYNSKNLPSQISSEIRQCHLELAIKKLRKHLFTYKEKIIGDCLAVDQNRTGFVQIHELISILNKYVANIPYKEIKDRLCECEDTSNEAKYDTLFNSIQTSSKYKSMPDSISENFKLLVSIFHMIDVDNNGSISPDEFKKACTKIFNYLGTRYTEEEIAEFIKIIDQNNDEKIDLQEFSNAFSVSCTN